MDRTSLDMTPLWPPRNLFCSCVAGEVSWLQERTSSLKCPAILVLEFWSIENESPWRRKWQPTPVFLPGKFHGERSLVGYSSWGKKKKKKKKKERMNLQLLYHGGGWTSSCLRFTNVVLFVPSTVIHLSLFMLVTDPSYLCVIWTQPSKRLLPSSNETNHI